MVGEVIKTCCKCKQLKQHSIRGRICRDCKKQYDSEYVALHKEKLYKQGLEYRSNPKQKELKKEYDKQYREDNFEKRLGHKIKDKINGKNFERARKAHLKRVYNLTIDDYNNLLILQDHKCKICGVTESIGKSKLLFIDHCHDTGKIRGLLCHNCNMGLGLFKDNIGFLKSAIEYLENNK